MNIRTSLALFLGVLTISACSMLSVLSNSVQTSEIASAVTLVTERHDSYVLADTALSPEARAADLQESAALAGLLQLIQVDRPTFAFRLSPVATRHDAYVEIDAALSPLEQKIYLRTTAELRALAAVSP